MKKCPKCNRTYSDDSFSFCLEDGALLSASYDADATLVIRGRGGSSSDERLPIDLIPDDEESFKQQLLRSKRAEILTSYADGRVRRQIWHANSFRPSSNLMGNLRSRPDFRKDRWQTLGIVKVTVRVLDHS